MQIINVLTIPKIGDGTEDNPIRPDTLEQWWQVIEETETTFTIQVLGG